MSFFSRQAMRASHTASIRDGFIWNRQHTDEVFASEPGVYVDVIGHYSRPWNLAQFLRSQYDLINKVEYLQSPNSFLNCWSICSRAELSLSLNIRHYLIRNETFICPLPTHKEFQKINSTMLLAGSSIGVNWTTSSSSLGFTHCFILLRGKQFDKNAVKECPLAILSRELIELYSIVCWLT